MAGALSLISIGASFANVRTTCAAAQLRPPKNTAVVTQPAAVHGYYRMRTSIDSHPRMTGRSMAVWIIGVKCTGAQRFLRGSPRSP